MGTGRAGLGGVPWWRLDVLVDAARRALREQPTSGTPPRPTRAQNNNHGGGGNTNANNNNTHHTTAPHTGEPA